jgi:hypothetical protein
LSPAGGRACRRGALANATAALVLLLALLLLPAQAGSHTRSVSYSSWQLDDREARVVLRVPQIELTRLPWGPVAAPHLHPGLGDYLTSRLRLAVDGAACRVVSGPRALASPPDRAVIEWRVACPEGGLLALESGFLAEVAPSHLHFVRLRRADEPVLERVLSEASPRWILEAPDGADAELQGTSVAAYLVLGVEHIVTGYDHLAFLLALLLLARRVRDVVAIVTGFTVAHSITLALAALGRVEPDDAAVESLIGLSIALVAAENAWVLSGRPRLFPPAVAGLLLGLAGLAAAGFGVVPGSTFAGLALFAFCYFELVGRLEQPVRLRFAIAFCFGLVHGFGFAGFLGEMGLPRDRVVPALLGFNLGVEVGQLALVAVIWPLLRLLAARRLAWHRRLVEVGTALVCAMGVYWLVERAFG